MVYYKSTQLCSDVAQMWSWAETKNWILPLIPTFPVRMQRTSAHCRVNGRDCVCLLKSSGLSAGARNSWLLNHLLPSFGSFLQSCRMSTETTGRSVLKWLVCHLSKASRAKKRRKNQHENTTIWWTLAHTQLGCFGNMVLILSGLLFFHIL